MTKKIAIIGAGITGLTLANKLQENGLEVQVFDKGRGVGGRISSRRTEWGYIDHGAQYLTVRDEQFLNFLNSHISPELIVPWKQNFAIFSNHQLQPEKLNEFRYVAVPSMSNLCKQLANNLSVKLNTRIANLVKVNNHQWNLIDTNNNVYNNYDLVIITAPPQQTANLLGNHTNIAQEIAQIEMLSCFSLMLIPQQKINFSYQGIKCKHEVLGWIGANDSKPLRNDNGAVVIQSNFDWAAKHIDDNWNDIGNYLQTSAEEILKVSFNELKYKAVHRWLYANPKKTASYPYFWDKKNYLAACGDWCVAGRIEGGFLSAMALFNTFINSITN